MIVYEKLQYPEFPIPVVPERQGWNQFAQSPKQLCGRQVLSLHELNLLANDWEELCRANLQDNVYYGRNYASALLETLEHRPVKFLAAWRGEQLIGLLPVTINHISMSGFRPRGQGWSTPYTFMCMPLLHRDHAEEAAIGLLGSMRSISPGDWHLQDFYLTGAVAEVFCRAADAESVAWGVRHRYERAMFRRKGSLDAHLSDFVPSKRRRDLQRNRRRLEALGTITHEASESGPELERAVEAFLALEKKGWKGRRRTALACHKETLEFARQAMCPSGEARVRADVLLLDGVPVAVGIMVLSGGTAFTIKGAYDEDYAGYSVGLLLELEVVRAFLDGDWANCLDSATAGKHVIDFLWPDRQAVGDLYISFRPDGAHNRFRRYEALKDLKIGLRARVKRLIGR